MGTEELVYKELVDLMERSLPFTNERRPSEGEWRKQFISLCARDMGEPRGGIWRS